MKLNLEFWMYITLIISFLIILAGQIFRETNLFFIGSIIFFVYIMLNLNFNFKNASDIHLFLIKAEKYFFAMGISFFSSGLILLITNPNTITINTIIMVTGCLFLYLSNQYNKKEQEFRELIKIKK